MPLDNDSRIAKLPRQLADLLNDNWIGFAIEALIASTLIAQRSLYQHVARVRRAFTEGGLPAARQAVATWTFRRTSAERVYLVAVFNYEGDKAQAEIKRAE